MIKGTAESILLGNPALKSFGALIEPGTGIHLRQTPKAANKVTQRQTPANQKRALALEAADTAKQTLPPLALAVIATDTTVIPAFGREWISLTTQIQPKHKRPCLPTLHPQAMSLHPQRGRMHHMH